MTDAGEVIAKYLDDAHAIHPGHMTASGLLARLTDAGYVVLRVPPSGACRNCGHSKYSHDDEAASCYHGIDDDDVAPCTCTAYERVDPAAGLGG